MQVPLTELQSRMNRFRTRMDVSCPDWEVAVIFGRINLFYFTGTMQDGMLVVPRSDSAILWVRRSYERALDESLFPQIKPMSSFRDAAGSLKQLPARVYLDAEVVPLALYQRFHKHFPFAEVRSVDTELGWVRAVKSSFELSLMEQSGRIHQRVLEERVPALLREGISEAEFAAELLSVMVAEGHHGVVRFGMADNELALGLVSFGESSLYPVFVDGPGGNLGMSPAAPLVGSRTRKLKKGDLVFIDTGCSVEGYHTDKTLTYLFGQTRSDEVRAAQAKCVEIQNQIASMLTPGAIPSRIYETVLSGLDPAFLNNFMGFGNRRVKFLGHGIGLFIDELPALAKGFDEPLLEGMTLAVEPKKGIEGVGMVGIENTFLVTPKGGRSLTGCSPGLIQVN
jgi:Xaa-Pro dipeptidase